MGYFAKNGSYVIDWKKVRTYVVPEDLDQFKVRTSIIRLFSACVHGCWLTEMNHPAHPVRDQGHGPGEKQIHIREGRQGF